MPGLLHESAVSSACAQYGFQVTGFGRAYRSVMVDDSEEARIDFLEECKAEGMSSEDAAEEYRQVMAAEKKNYRPGFVPDGFLVREDEKKIICMEVEDTSQMTEVKFSNYLNVWFYLDCECWSMEIWIFDRYGKRTHILDDDYLCHSWHQKIQIANA